MKFLLSLWTVLLLIGIDPANGQILIPKGSAWNYLDDGSDQGTAWKAPGFDDASWNSLTANLKSGTFDAEPASWKHGKRSAPGQAEGRL